MKRVLIALLLCIPLLAQAPHPQPPPKDTAELEQRVMKLLSEQKTPGACLTIVDRKGPVWSAGLGKADVAAGKPVSPDTLFRIGSVSKIFAALAALKLQEEGRLDLQAPLRSLAPEVKFENPWEATDPVRIVHLLEHTAGWDDLSAKEYACNDSKPLTLKEGLDYSPRSRTCRWKPGTRFSYCNSGPAVVAYVVEKITGSRFEDYVAGHFFKPLGMPTADYFLSPAAQSRLTRLYFDDGKRTHPYWHIIMRPAGSINASANEMGRLVQFFLNRGSVDGAALLPPSAIERMETPTTYWGAQAGLKTGYGLHNYTSVDDQGFVWHGHNGGVDGGLTELAYLPEQGIGYFFSINSGSGEAFQAIGKLMKEYLTKDFPKPALPPPAPISAELARAYGGWYQPDSPRQQDMQFMERILGLSRVRFEGERMIVKDLFGPARIFYATGAGLFRRDTRPVASAVFMEKEGHRILQSSSATARRVPAALVWLELLLTVLVLLAFLSTLFFALVWIPRFLFKRMRSVRHLSMRVWPLLSALCLIAAVIFIVLTGEDAISRMGNPTVYSLGFMACTWALAVTTLLSLIAAGRAERSEMKAVVYWHSWACSVLFAVMTVYLAYWGMVGYRSWI